MLRRSFMKGVALAGIAAATVPSAFAQADPLPSWNDGAAKKAIIGFVTKVTTEGSSDFVKPAEQWAHGIRPQLNQPENWGLADQPLEERLLCRARWSVTDASAAA